MIPYTYYIFHRPTRQHYYGVKFAQDADPDLFWKTYFTSSNAVKALIEEYGEKSFDVSIRRTFNNAKEAILWEAKFLNRIDAKGRKDWLNQHNSDGKFLTQGPLTEKHKRNLSNANKGNILSNETKKKISNSKKGKTLSAEAKRNMSLAKISLMSNMTADERIEKYGKNKGIPLTDEHKSKISNAVKGKSRSRETKQNISKAFKGRTWRIVDGKRKWFDKENTQ